MTHNDKVKALVAELGVSGIRPLSVVPPIYSWLWRVGILVPPPHCQHWAGLCMLTSLCFVCMFLLLTLLWRWRSPALPDWVLWALPLAGGAIFGLLLTAAYRYAAVLLRLPGWRDYPGAAGSPQPALSSWVRCDAWVRLLFAVVIVAILVAAGAGVPN